MQKIEPKLFVIARKGLVKMLWLGLLIYIAYLLAQLTWFLISGSSSDRSETWLFSSVPESTGGQPNSKYNPALYKLFGQVKTRAIKLASTQVVPRTNLQLILFGVFAANEKDGISGAIVAEKGKRANYYRVGEMLPGEAKLAEVFDDHILLNRNGKFETLYFEKNDGNKNKIASVKNIASRSLQTISTPKQFVEVATRRLAQNPRAALASVGLTVVSEGQDNGYVYNGSNPMLQALNLKRGDVIKSVNGYQLGDISKDKKLLQQLYKDGNLNVEVVRGNTRFYVDYPLK